MDYVLTLPADRDEQARRIYSTAFGRIMLGFSELKTFRDGVRYSEEAVGRRFMRDAADTTVAMLAGDLQRLITDKDGFLKAAGGADGLATTVSKMLSSTYRAAADSASLIFAHAIVDTVASEACVVASLVSPSSWAKAASSKTVSLAEIADAGPEELLAKVAFKEACALGRSCSLVQRAKLLFGVCGNLEDSQSAGYQFDQVRLEAFDKARQDIAHRSELASLPNGDEDITWLSKTATLFLVMLHNRFGVQIDAEETVRRVR